jgi:hypothetical protein
VYRLPFLSSSPFSLETATGSEVPKCTNARTVPQLTPRSAQFHSIALAHLLRASLRDPRPTLLEPSGLMPGHSAPLGGECSRVAGYDILEALLALSLVDHDLDVLAIQIVQ